MGRHKGSKNRKTLVKELVERGGDANRLEHLAYEALEREYSAVLAKEPARPEFTDATMLDPKRAKAIVDEVRSKFGEMVEHYAPGRVDVEGKAVEVPPRIQDYLRKAFYAKDEEEARYIAKRSIDKLFILLMALWKWKRIGGPAEPRREFHLWVT